MPEANTFDPAVLDRLEQLRDKYAAMGQDLVSYLDGLLHADFPTYWDYINLDTLLSLQHPVTPFPTKKSSSSITRRRSFTSNFPSTNCASCTVHSRCLDLKCWSGCAA